MLGRSVVIALVVAWPLASALAQSECPVPARGPLETTPISGSSGVAINAMVRARYPAGHLEQFAERIELFDEEGERVPGELEAEADALFFIPDEELSPNRSYEAVASGVDHDIVASFRTGASRDLEPPTAPVLLEAEAAHASATCSQPEGGVRLSFLFRTSTDDASIASLRYHLYRTRGPGASAPEILARVHQEVFAGETQALGAVLGEREAAGVSCFVVVAEDGLFQTASSEELCFEPGIGVIFDSLCSATDPSSAARGLAPTALLLALLSFRARRRRHRGKGLSIELD